MAEIRSSRLTNPFNPVNRQAVAFMQAASVMTGINDYAGAVQHSQLSVNPPISSKRLNLTGTIPLPVAAGTYNVIKYTVPFGWIGYINYFVNKYSGTGFVDGSGDLVWGIGINNYFPVGYGNITVQQGDLGTSSLVSDTGIQIRSNQVITFNVTWNGNNLLGGNLLCAIFGWVAPINATLGANQ